MSDKSFPDIFQNIFRCDQETTKYLEIIEGVPVLLTWSSFKESKVFELGNLVLRSVLFIASTCSFTGMGAPPDALGLLLAPNTLPLMEIASWLVEETYNGILQLVYEYKIPKIYLLIIRSDIIIFNYFNLEFCF